MGKKDLDSMLCTRFPASLKAAIDEAAKKEGESASELIRRFVRAGIAGDVKPVDTRPLAQAVNQLGKDLGRVGGNLNQIAHYMNSRDDLKEKELAQTHRELQGQFKKVSQEIKGLRNELNRRS